MAGPRMKTEVMFSHRKHLFSKGPVNHSIFKNPGLAAWWMNCSFYAATFEQNGSHYWRFNPYVWLTWGGESLYWCSLKSIKITHFPRKTIVSLRFMSAKHMFFLRRKTYHHILFFSPCSFSPLFFLTVKAVSRTRRTTSSWPARWRIAPRNRSRRCAIDCVCGWGPRPPTNWCPGSVICNSNADFCREL